MSATVEDHCSRPDTRGESWFDAQQQTDQAALEYVQLHGMKVALKLARERGDRLQKSIMEAHMWLSVGENTRALQTLSQALI